MLSHWDSVPNLFNEMASYLRYSGVLLEGRKLMLKLNEGWQVNESRYARVLLAKCVSVCECSCACSCVHGWVGGCVNWKSACVCVRVREREAFPCPWKWNSRVCNLIRFVGSLSLNISLEAAAVAPQLWLHCCWPKPWFYGSSLSPGGIYSCLFFL